MENEICGPHLFYIYITNDKQFFLIDRTFFLFYFIFFLSHFFLRFTEIEPSEFVGARRIGLYSMRATRRNQKHRISPSF